MKAEEIPDEWVDIAFNMWWRPHVGTRAGMRAAIAAVAPLIAAAEREACAQVAAEYHNTNIHGPWNTLQTEIAAAIRDRGNK